MTSIGKSTTGASVPINVERLIETRMLVTSRSGGGKSWALRRLLEQTHGQVQQIVIDVEDEFYTLRERFDYVLAGRQGGDCPADPRCAALLARKLLELRVSAIIGIYELKAHERIQFVRLFLESLVDAPKELWHQALIVIDEAHIFAPESAKCESKQAVVDLMTRGRKRGFCGILASQRVSNLDKNASAQAINKLIGGFSQDIDVKRSAEDLGFYRREEQAALRSLRPGSFFAVGPALCEQVTELVVGPVVTTHPRAGQRAMAPPPPAESVRRVLAQLADLPHEAEREAVTIAELQKQIRELRARTITPEQRAEIENRVKAQYEGEIRALRTAIQRGREILLAAGGEVQSPDTPIAGPARLAPLPRMTVDAPRKAEINGALTGPERRIIDAIAWMEAIGIDAPEQTAVAFLAGYTVGGGAWNNPRGALRTKGMIEYSGVTLRLTDDGRKHATYPSITPTTEALQRAVMDKLPGPERKILEVLIREYPKALANDECARASGYEPGGGAYNNPRGRLRTLGLIEYSQPGYLKARGLLFLEGR